MENSSRFLNLYKCHNTKSDLQEKRRKLLLNEQKENRTRLQDNLRGIKNFVQKIRQRKHYKHPTYSEKYDSNLSLQLSEWLKEQPEDLNCWYLVPCPKGKRCLLIASDGCTEAYTKSGRFIKSFHTLLPGDRVSKQQVTILDCIFIEQLSMYYVLDILVYANQDFINCETEFRFFWIKSKFSEDSFHEKCESNEYPFIPLCYYNFDDELSIESCLSKYPQWNDENLILDGFLFYHKEASYTCGSTPLVGWLFGFMIPEVLHINVNEKYLDEKPKDYVDYLHYIIIFDENMSKRNNKAKKNYNKKIKSDDDFIDDSNPDDSNESSNFMEILDTEKNLELEGRLFDDIEEIKE